jgi:predicted RNA binding protein YcfA (HicA-like mRNA interferase family)
MYERPSERNGSGDDCCLQKAGFRIIRTKGSRQLLRHSEDPIRTTTVSTHPGDLPPGTVRSILKQVKLSREEFLNLL